MYFWNFSSEHAAKNLAYDEALLEVIDDQAEQSQQPAVEAFRVWEMPGYTVILGRSSIAHDEARVENCQRSFAPILRRCSGGATVLAGPGCLMYSAVLSIDAHPQLAMIDAAHDFVMQRLLSAVQACQVDAQRAGICDLVCNAKKFSGNALRLKRHAVLYHGTLLYSMDMNVMQSLLGSPARQPEYRQGRNHQDFVDNIAVGRGALIRELRQSFQADQDWSLFEGRSLVELKANQLLTERYSKPEWNFAR